MEFLPSNYIGPKRDGKADIKMYKEIDFVAEARRVLEKAQQHERYAGF